MLWDFGPICQCGLAKIALQFDSCALNTQMHGQYIPIVEILLGAATVVTWLCVDAFEFDAARLPVLSAHLVFEGRWALFTIEVRVVQLLHDKAIHIFAQA